MKHNQQEGPDNSPKQKFERKVIELKPIASYFLQGLASAFIGLSVIHGAYMGNLVLIPIGLITGLALLGLKYLLDKSMRH